MPLSRSVALLAVMMLALLSCSGLAKQAPQALSFSEPLLVRYDSDKSGDISVAVHVWQRDYAVPGGSLGQVRANLELLHLGGIDGDFSAYTKWDLRLGLQYDHGEPCNLRNATVEVDAVVTLPGLQDRDALQGSDLAEWQRYLKALSDHEMSHVHNEVVGADALRGQLAQLGSAQDCTQLAQEITTLGDQEKESIRQADVTLDAETEHGALTGATFR
jgi:predicted secreted Zn-dependent protease